MVTVLSFLQIAIVFLIFVFILTREVSVRLLWSNELLLEINFTFFAFVFSKSKEVKNKAGKNKNDSSPKKGKLSVIIKTLEHGLSRARLEVGALRFPSELVNAPIIKGLAYIPASAILIYLSKKSREVRYSAAPSSPDAFVDLTARATLLHLVFTVVFYFLERLKSKSKARARR